ncbi:chromosome partitioning protein ParA [Cerasibacillus terrae]|uniref:Chromosome partitioning protein ParA n=2 Tax=Cerasibacillus terrae TaxID=2498845 RepID=A0A5C8P3S6_9BACI|nr:chromosome partitioning protein ParA [Cerasibacillus terrae]
MHMDIFPNQIFKNKSLKTDIQLRFLNRLSQSLNNGYPLLAALEAFQWDYELRKPAERIILSLRNGVSFDKALEEADFHPTITSFLYFTKDGNLTENIEKCAELFEKRMKHTKKLKQISRYPFILFIIFAVLLFFIKKSVLPSFIDLFQSTPNTGITIKFSIFFINLLFQTMVMIIFITLITALVWYVIKHKWNIERRIKIYHRIPIFRQYIQLHTSYLFATHISTLLKTGIPLKEILTIMHEQKNLPIIAFYTGLMTEQLKKGVYITSLLQSLPLLDPKLGMIFQKHSDRYALETDLTIYAELKAEEFHERLMKMIISIQPIFFICLACFIIFIYIALMWPMFQLIKTV